MTRLRISDRSSAVIKEVGDGYSAVSDETIEMAKRKIHCTLPDSLLDFLNLGLAEALDVLKFLLGGYVDRLQEEFSE